MSRLLGQGMNFLEVPGRKAMSKVISRGFVVGIAAAIQLAALPAQAQSVADFYRGKTLRM